MRDRLSKHTHKCSKMSNDKSKLSALAFDAAKYSDEVILRQHMADGVAAETEQEGPDWSLAWTNLHRLKIYPHIEGVVTPPAHTHLPYWFTTNNTQ